MTDTNNITTKIVNHLNLNRHKAHRQNTVGIRGRTISKGSRYIGDILCCWKGGSWLEIEVKTGNDRQSEGQKQRQKDILRTGGVYIVITTFDEYLQWYGKYDS